MLASKTSLQFLEELQKDGKKFDLHFLEIKTPNNINTS